MNTLNVSVNCSEELKKTVTEFFKENFSNVNFIELEQQKDGICFCAGGDGSLNYVVNALAKDNKLGDIRICYYAAGTGNDFARSTKLFDMSLEDTLKLTLTKKTSKVNLGKFNDEFFINMATCGEFARVTTEVDRTAKDILGPLAYFVSGLSKISELQGTECEFEIDSKPTIQEKVFGFFIGNSKYCGGGVMATNQADALSADLDFLMIQEMPINELLALGIYLQTGNSDLEERNATYEKIQSMKFRSKQEIPVNLDGERLMCREGHIRISQSSVLMYLP